LKWVAVGLIIADRAAIISERKSSVRI